MSLGQHLVENPETLSMLRALLAQSVTIMVWTPTLCIPDTSDRPGYFFILLSNLAMSLITYGAPCITLLCSTFIATLLHI